VKVGKCRPAKRFENHLIRLHASRPLTRLLNEHSVVNGAGASQLENRLRRRSIDGTTDGLVIEMNWRATHILTSRRPTRRLDRLG
jgi:hypothetical protein